MLSVAAFGNAVHVAGTDANLLEQALHDLRSDPAMHIAPSTANLEDVFINLMAQAPDNFAAPPAHAGAKKP